MALLTSCVFFSSKYKGQLGGITQLRMSKAYKNVKVNITSYSDLTKIFSAIIEPE